MPILLILGPTASGKTSLGLELCKKIGGEIISADSMQIYQGMDIGTAKATPEELKAAAHHLINTHSPDQAYNAGLFTRDAKALIQDIQSRGKNPILLGGTSLYLRSLLFGIIDLPDTTAAVKAQVQELFQLGGLSACHQKLAELDSASGAKLHPNDQSRVLRALEVFLEHGKSILDFQQEQEQKPQYSFYCLGRQWPREVLYERINQRVHEMVGQGLIAETKALLDAGFDPQLQPMRSIGYKQAVLYLQGKLSEAEMIAEIQQKSRHYAKKQLTWLQKWPNLHWLEGAEPLGRLLPEIQEFLLHSKN